VRESKGEGVVNFSRYKSFHASENMRLLRMLSGVDPVGAIAEDILADIDKVFLDVLGRPEADEGKSYAQEACEQGPPDRDEDCSDLG
jgi:hypothetical protein